MGVDVVASDELDRVRELFELWDRTFSLFRDDSELSRVNAEPARIVAVSPLFAHLVAVALDAARASDGLVDPTLRGRWRELRLTGRLLGRPAGLHLDLNGVVKGLAVDEALALLPGPGFVSAGGDVASRGSTVVALPGGGSLTLTDGGLATSGTTKRGDHLVDPRSGRPAQSCWTEVTVAAASCLAADIAAKAAFIASQDGPAWLDARGLPGRFRAGDVVVVNSHWRAAMEAHAA
jgi:FAD:protein FMN transferase